MVKNHRHSDRILTKSMRKRYHIIRFKSYGTLHMIYFKWSILYGPCHKVHIISHISYQFKYDTTEKFSLRNTIFQMERKLKSEIQQRTGLLARAQQTELFNIREVLRAERKNLTKVSETAENTYRVTQQEIKQMRTEIARKNKETQDRMDKQSVQTHNLVREVDQRITMTKKSTDQESFNYPNKYTCICNIYVQYTIYNMPNTVFY